MKDQIESERSGKGGAGSRELAPDGSGLLTERGDLTIEILNIMEQGIILWDGDGTCRVHNNRVFRVLELSGGDIAVGSTIEDFIARAVRRSEITPEVLRYYEGQVNARQPYTFDLRMPSGRMILTNGRPTRGGGYVVTFTDVTMARRASEELDTVKSEAVEARIRAEEVLAHERARQTEARLLSGLDEWLQSCKSLDELFKIVTTFMVRLLPGSAGQLFVYSNSRDVLEGVCAWPASQAQDYITADSCWSLRRGRHYEFRQEGLCLLCDHVTEALVPGDDPDHYICVPVVAHGDTVGLLHFRLDGLDRKLVLHDPAGFAVRCGEHISLAIANVKLRDELRDQSIRDPLTGLFNRRHFMEAMRHQLGVSKRTNRGFAVISFDADRFKAFNDNHGHDAGDMVLRTISDVLKDRLSGEEVACRMGGEEFAILVPGASLQQAAELADLIRGTMETTQVRYLDIVLPAITISAGVAAFPEQGPDLAAVLRAADRALYAAKDGGRNRVCLAED